MLSALLRVSAGGAVNANGGWDERRSGWTADHVGDRRELGRCGCTLDVDRSELNADNEIFEDQPDK
jgi:hypothetical protein